MSQKLIDTRNSSTRINHCAGKTSFGKIVEEYMNAGNEAPLVAALEKVYRKDDNGRKLTEAIKSKMEELQQERSEVGSSGDLTPTEQIEIIAEAKGKKKGTCILGNSVRRHPLPRGGVTANFRAYEEIQQELERNKKELEKVNEDRQREREEADAFRRELMANFKALQEEVRLVRTGRAPQPAQNATEGPSTSNPSSS